MIGKTLKERYTLTASLGRGGMGEVYLAVDSWQYNRPVAIKVLQAQFAQDKTQLNRFRLEAGILKQLNHPNVVEYIEDFAAEGHHFIVMEYVGGGNLLDLQRGSEPLNAATFRRITLAITDALTRAHDNSIVHRDIKPENILLTEDGVPKLSDFGVAWLLEAGDDGVAGSPYYMSPQRWDGEQARQVDDIWSLGVVMFEMLAGEVPFYGRTEMATVHAIMHDPTPDLRERRPDLPAGYAAIVERCLEKASTRRYNLMRKVGADLEGGEPSDGTDRREGLFPQRRRYWPLVALLIVLLLALVGGGFFLVARQPAPSPTPLPTATQTPVQTATPFFVTATPHSAAVIPATPTRPPTVTPFVITATAEPSNTPEPTLTPSNTSTITPTPTVTLTLTPVVTATLAATATLTEAPSATPTATLTVTHTPSHTPLPSATPTITPSITNTARPTLTPSHTPTGTPDLLATEQAHLQATLDQISTDTAPTATLTASPQPTPTVTPDLAHWPVSMRVLDDFSSGAGRWELPPGWRLATVDEDNTALAANEPGSARRMDAADWGQHYSWEMRFRLGQGGFFEADLLGDLARCQAVYVHVNEGGVALRYNDRPAINGDCRRDAIPIVAVEESISGFVWHTLRLEVRADLLLVHLDGTRVIVAGNPLADTLEANGMLTIPVGATPPLYFDDFVVNQLNPRSDVDLVWLGADAFCVQDFATDPVTTGVALEAAIEGDYVDAIWAVGEQHVEEQSYMLYPDLADSVDQSFTHYWHYSTGGDLEPGIIAMIPLHEDTGTEAIPLEVTGRRFITPHRGNYAFQNAPTNVRAVLTAQGIELAWIPVMPLEGGFNPGGAYLIRIHNSEAGLPDRLFNPLYEDRGAASVPRYRIPWGRIYRPPDATGPSITELPPGEYEIEVWAVSARPSSRDECRAIDSSETLGLSITENGIVTVTMADGMTVSDQIER